MRVLIVDDDPLMREVLSEAVRSISDFACSTAHDGRAAWRLIRAEAPEVVIADWRMPGLDGMQLCRRIRAHEGPGYTYVILLTAFSGAETRLEAMRVGADDFLTKPYQLAELQASLLGAERVVAVHRRRAESEREARTNADRLERFIEATSDAIIAIDRERRIMAWNRGAELMFGWRRDEVLGKVSPTVPPELEGEVLQFRRAILEDGETLPNFRTIRLTRDGRRIAVLGTYSPLRDGDGRVVGVVATVKDLSVHEELEERHRQLAVLEERERIARDLHDGVIQSLFGVALRLEAQARSREPKPALARRNLRAAEAEIDRIVDEIRAYVAGLQTPSLRGADPAEQIRVVTGQLLAGYIEPRLTLDAEAAGRLDPEPAAQVVQVVREALSNVRRHARARAVEIRLEPVEAGLMLSIRDDGRGFDPTLTGRRAGDGLRNMAERARRLGGTLSIESRPGTGALIRLVVPAHGANRPA